jgi:hypothetical protein
MKTTRKPKAATASQPEDFVSRSKAAAKIMAKELRAEHKRWNLPLLSWKDGKVVKTWP